MNPFDLDATGLMLWGLVAHLIADWPLQNEWMALNKMKRNTRYWTSLPEGYDRGKIPLANRWWDRHPAAYVHAGIHLVFLAFVFGWVAIPLAFAHLVIDCRWMVEKWSKLIKQTQPKGHEVISKGHPFSFGAPIFDPQHYPFVPAYDVGTEVRFWTDQVFHIITIAIAALIVGSI